MTLSEKLALLRREKGLSQMAVAEALHVSRQAVSRWEQGAAAPSSDNLIYLSELYGITLDELIYGKKKEEDSKTANQAAENKKPAARTVEIIIALCVGAIAAGALFFFAAQFSPQEEIPLLEDWNKTSVADESITYFSLG